MSDTDAIKLFSELFIIAMLIIITILLIIITSSVSVWILQQQAENGNMPCFYYRTFHNNENIFSMNTTKVQNIIKRCNLSYEERG
jgi:hypothetical protein